ncbi:MAG: cyclic nucleotide-binding domain-containing protein [Nitrospirae bacterium]|nr:MAG: cyclic nucleotide-binding domain-containing protein [Nitrospirota bacterium]
MSNIWTNIFKPRQTEEDTILAVLMRIPIFEGLDSKELRQIENILHQREYAKQETIFFQGEPGLGMYIIIQGDVDIISEPEKHQLAELHEGDFFGELSLLDESPRTASAVAKDPSRLLCLFQSDLNDLITRNPGLGVKILVQLARTIGARLRKTNDHVTELKKVYQA